MDLKIFFIVLIVIIILTNKKIYVPLLCLVHIKKLLIKYKNSIKFNKEEAYKILHDVTPILEKYNIFFWLSEGTALGVYRDNDLIDHDDDVDISFRSEYLKTFKDKVIPELKKLGYTIGKLASLYYIMNDHIILDVDVLFENSSCGAKYWQPVKELEPHIKDFYIKEFRGHKYNIPKESYYEYLYGKDYMIPLKKKPQFSLF